MDLTAQASRRDLWFTTVRTHLPKVFNEDGSGKIPQFNPQYIPGHPCTTLEESKSALYTEG